MKKNNKPTKKSSVSRIVRFTVKFILFFILFFILVVLFIRSPWGQNLIIHQLTDYVSSKTNTAFTIKRFYLSFDGNLMIDNLYIEDQTKDTLLYSRHIEIDIPLVPIFKNNHITIEDFKWEKSKVNIYRMGNSIDFNYQFLIDAFASDKPKEESSSAYDFEIKNLDFQNIQLSYLDEHNQLSTNLTIGKAAIGFKEFDLKESVFQLHEIKLANTNFIFHQGENKTVINPSNPTDKKEDIILPNISIDKLLLDNIRYTFTDKEEKLSSNGKIHKFQLIDSSFDLGENDFQIDSLYLAESFINLDLASSSTDQEANEKVDFIWPLFDIKIKSFQVFNNQYQITQNQTNISKNLFDASALGFEEFNLELKDFNYSRNEMLDFKLVDFSFKESSGLQLKKFQFNIVLDQQKLLLNNLEFATSKNKLAGTILIEYSQFNKWINNPTIFENTNLDLTGNISLTELSIIENSMKNLPYFKELASSPIMFSIHSKGNLKNLELNRLNVAWSSSEVSGSGQLFSLNTFDKFNFKLNKYEVSSLLKDYSKFITAEQLTNVNLPATIQLSGAASGSALQLKTKSLLRIPEGEMVVNASLLQGDYIRLNTDIDLVKMDVGKIFNQPKIQPISVGFQTQVEGKNWQTLKGEFSSSIRELQYADMDFSALDIAGTIQDKDVYIDADFDSEFLRFNSISTVRLDSLQPQINIDFDLEGIDLKKFGLSSRNIRAKTRLNANVKGYVDDFQFEASIDSTLVVYDNNSYVIQKIAMNAKANSKLTNFNIQSRFLNSDLKANAHPNEIITSLKAYINTLFSKEEIQEDNLEKDTYVQLDFNLRFQETPFISEVLFEKMEELDTLSLAVSFSEKEKKLSAQLDFPKLIYNESQLDKLSFQMEADSSTVDFNFGFQTLTSGLINIAQTQLYGGWKNDELHLNFEAYDKESPFFNINAIVNRFEDEFILKIIPQNFILNGKPWDIPSSNKAIYTVKNKEKGLQFFDFEFTRKQQYIAFRNDFDINEVHTGILFKDFKLSTLSNYISADEGLVKGILSGYLIIINPFQKPGIISDLSITDLLFQNHLVGNINFNATSNLDDTYQFTFEALGEDLQLSAVGKIDHTSQQPVYSSSINLGKIELQLIEKFSNTYISDTKGRITGNFELGGEINHLAYTGNINFKNAQVKLNALNAIFKLGNETVDISEKALNFKNFHLKDVNDNIFDINGKIGMVDFSNPTFDIQAKASNFQLLNSTVADNDLYYGKLNFDTDFKLLGDLKLPKIKGNLSINNTTDFTYLIPDAQVGTVEREGVVLFVNKKNPDDILTRQNKDQYAASISGIEIDAQINVSPETKANVVFNKKTGDNIKLVGGGKLKFDINKNGDLSLSGKYEVNKGELELNLYNLVTRRFQIGSKSSVTWYGDPYNANLDIRAIYNIETSASSLMASQITSESSAVQNQFRQQLPFQVYLDVKGEISTPELSFELDMPESNRGAVNGTVYNRVVQINQQVDELNKQVFSLLVLNRFYPTTGNDGSQGGAASLARNNINQALSDQLNTYANKLTGNTGIQLSFDVNSYTDFQSGSANNRTDVDISAQKKLLDDRLIVEAGSQVNVEGDLRPGEHNVALGNVSVQYILTPDGRWKIKGFRRSEYENVIDGQVFISGIALIFTREFNRFIDLWSKKNMQESE